jgi:hypothetical protein
LFALFKRGDLVTCTNKSRYYSSIYGKRLQVRVVDNAEMPCGDQWLRFHSQNGWHKASNFSYYKEDSNETT